MKFSVTITTTTTRLSPVALAALTALRDSYIREEKRDQEKLALSKDHSQKVKT